MPKINILENLHTCIHNLKRAERMHHDARELVKAEYNVDDRVKEAVTRVNQTEKKETVALAVDDHGYALEILVVPPVKIIERERLLHNLVVDLGLSPEEAISFANKSSRSFPVYYNRHQKQYKVTKLNP